MRSIEFVLIGALVISSVCAQMDVAGDDMANPEHGNCTVDEVSGFLEDCKTAHLTVNKDSAGATFSSLGASEDPFNIWAAEVDYCSKPEELSSFLECYYDKIEECHLNSSMTDDLPAPENVKSAVLYLCKQKEAIYESRNMSDVDECLTEKRKDIVGCMGAAVGDNPALANDKCESNAKMVTCVAPLNECTDEPVFETYVKYFSPARCGACTLTATLTLLLLALFAASFN